MNKEVAYSTMVENIPQDKRSSPALYGYFDNLFPGKVQYKLYLSKSVVFLYMICVLSVHITKYLICVPR